MNSIALFCASAIINHPHDTNGAVKSMIFFLPSHPEKMPPSGENITPHRLSMAANDDPLFWREKYFPKIND